MASRSQQIRARFSVNQLGWGSLACLSCATLMAFWGLVSFQSEGFDWRLLTDSYFHHIVVFSLTQACLSAVISVALAWPVARSLYYLPGLPGKQHLLNLCLLCFVMPTLVVVTGLVVLFGSTGVLSPWVDRLVGETWNLYGLSGILLAHVYLNMPFAVRVLYLKLEVIPDSSWKLSRQLKLGRFTRFRAIEWPSLRSTLFIVTGFIFVLCFNSFAIVLALGGGPKSATLEVAIYQALKYDFNIPEALVYAWVQFVIAGLAFLLVSKWGVPSWLGGDKHESLWRPLPGTLVKRGMQCLCYFTALLLLLPIGAIVATAWQASLLSLDLLLLAKSFLLTVGLAVFSAALALLLAYFSLYPARASGLLGQEKRRVILEWWAGHALIAPAMVISVGLYIYLLRRIDIEQWWLVCVLLINAFLLVPFALQKLKPVLYVYDKAYGRLAASLKMTTRQRCMVEWHYAKPAVMASFSLTLMLAVGEVAVFSIFGDYQWPTLPWLIYSYAGTYRLAEASLVSLLLFVLCLGVLTLFNRWQPARGE
ncbi:MAG: thiamine/thiamine pyrophosphate ABC transporter permease ThiP [Gammaproteobacteria bacterium]|nr:MAG: thiamine/thiamine pyrophosphate ABC transporter permease ThiP [Gammaproteobacteria bacterium]